MIQIYELTKNELSVVIYALQYEKTTLTRILRNAKTIDNDFVRYAQQVVAIDNTIKELKQSHIIGIDTNTYPIITSLCKLTIDTTFAKKHPDSILFSKKFSKKARKLYRPATRLNRIIKIDDRYIKNII